MRKLFVSAFVLAAIFMLATSGLALEKTAAQFNGDDLGDWNAATTCSVGYYNICTGWIWIWSGFADGEVLGRVSDTCCDPGSASVLDGSYLYYWTGAQAGYGFTGTHAVYAVDASDCPTGAALASQPWLPASGWNLTMWGVNVPSRFVVTATIQDDLGLATPVALPSDGAGGACGLCFPTTRTTGSYFYGLDTSPICPGSALNDGACFVEWLGNALISGCVVSVEDESWGSIKSLYR